MSTVRMCEEQQHCHEQGSPARLPRASFYFLVHIPTKDSLNASLLSSEVWKLQTFLALPEAVSLGLISLKSYETHETC